ncbi:transcription antiterminator BglG [Collibacillus ludicampi]|uniref:Transcription antiterminator BglG n=1 Tax=Collibacillus ludicampi TaxID=2771369 RepID=A0AAV4LFW8_9BACL|nr:PRD domain-containing protein [Collibacillus ludicampi]GIM46731.1 transcription antiterminator BglG [Collibacillus ludicampi]
MLVQGSTPLNSRQQQILLLLLQSSCFTTLKSISDELQISIRTVQRELSGLKEILNEYGLRLNKKSGVGLSIEGDEEAKQSLFQQLSISKSIKIFSPEERQYFLMQLLLTLKEPTKLYYFSRKFNVTESTISNDLMKIEPWFEKHHIKLIRKPGLGVYIEGSEKNIRAAIIDLLYQHLSHEQLMDILSTYTYSLKDKMKLDITIRNRLLHFIDPETIEKIEKIVQRTEQWGYRMTDSAYVGLVVHIALAVQRLKHGEHITIDYDLLEKLKGTQEYKWADQIGQELSTILEIKIPESEVGYITMHLLGAKARRAHSIPVLSYIEEYVYQMVRIVEKEMKLNLENDLTLMENLVTHLESAIHRIQLHMDIRNPLLSHIKEKYPKIFAAACKAAAFLEQQLQCSIPEEEVGYLAMHFGAAVVRRGDMDRNRYHVLLVCTSGIGTSRLLAAQIEKELPHVQVVGTVSLLNLEDGVKNQRPFDLIISTVPFHYKNYQVVVVNPFLQPRDIELIEEHLRNLNREKREEMIKNLEIEDTVMKINRYREAMVDLLENIYFVPHVEAFSKEMVIQNAVEYVKNQFTGIQGDLLKEDLLKREKMGAWVLEEDQLAMLHCRSDAIEKSCIILLQLKEKINWGSMEEPIDIDTVLVLLASRNAPKEHIEIMSEISAALIEEEFVSVLKSHHFERIKKQIKLILSKGFLEKTKALIRGCV